MFFIMNPLTFNPILHNIIPKLIKYHDKYNRSAFIDTDPICIPHKFSQPEDIEIIGFLIAMLAWGKREYTIRAGNKLIELMDYAPYCFVLHFEDKDLKKLQSFVHRTFQFTDLAWFLALFQQIYRSGKRLKDWFASWISENDVDVRQGIIGWYNYCLQHSIPDRTKRFVPNILKGSAAKRLNMFFRWMVRKDERGVDFGIWSDVVKPSQLLIPLDVHTAKTAFAWGLLPSNRHNFHAVLQLTEFLKLIDPQDPVRFDFALFGASLFGEDD